MRTLGDQVHAFRSNRYRRLDNDELAEAILPVLGEIPDVEFPSTEITDTRLYLKAERESRELVTAARLANGTRLRCRIEPSR